MLSNLDLLGVCSNKGAVNGTCCEMVLNNAATYIDKVAECRQPRQVWLGCYVIVVIEGRKPSSGLNTLATISSGPSSD